MICPHQMIGRRFGCRVRTVRRVRSVLRKRRILRSQRPVNFIGRNVQQSEVSFFGFGQASVISSHFFQQREGPVNICADKIARASYRSIYMALGGKMHDSTRLKATEKAAQEGSVRDIAMDKLVSLIVRNGRQVVEIYDGGRIALHPPQNEIGSDESCSASDEDRVFHEEKYCQTALRAATGADRESSL